MKKQKKSIIFIGNFIIIVVIIGCIFYLGSSVTFTSFKSNVDGQIMTKAANWNIKINNLSLNNLTVDKKLSLNNVKWNTNHVRDNKIAPGSIGKVLISIDPCDSEVAIMYNFNIIDNNLDKGKVLTVSSIDSSNSKLVKTGPGIYTGVILLDDLKKGIKPSIELNLIWNDNGDVMYSKLPKDNFLDITFTAQQYRGEDIIPFEG